jgi:hypothetical protein
VIGLLFGSSPGVPVLPRSAVIEFRRRQPVKLAVWLLAFATAGVAVQALVLTHTMDVAARARSRRAAPVRRLVGGLLFGAGAIMTRGCGAACSCSPRMATCAPCCRD